MNEMKRKREITRYCVFGAVYAKQYHHNYIVYVQSEHDDRSCRI